MTLPETKVRVGLAYREAILLVLAIAESRKPTRVRFTDEFKKFYKAFNGYFAFPEKNIDHYSLMLRKLFKSQAIIYDQNCPILTANGRNLIESILSMQSDAFTTKWKSYLEYIQS